MENECYFCGISGGKEPLYDAVSDRELVKICEKCSARINIPIINRPSNHQLKEADRPRTVYERLYKMARLEDHKKQIEEQKKREDIDLKKKELELAQIMEKNAREKSISIKQKDELIENFHWEIMRQRRKRGISQKQLGEEIGESEVSIKMAERAILPKDYFNLIEKLENYFKIPLKKKSQIKPFNPVDSSVLEQTEKKLDFESRDFRGIKVGDLKDKQED